MRRTVLLAAAALLTLTGCGSDKPAAATPPELPPSTTSASPSTEASAAAPSTSGRGNHVKALGEIGGFCATDQLTCTLDTLVLSFTVDSIIPDIQCNSGFANPPDKGHFVGIALRVSTTPDYRADEYTTFTAADFSVIGPDGLTISDVQGQAALCLGPNGFTSDPLGSGQKYAGTVVIDSPVTSGVLVYMPPASATGGWEWQF